MVRVRRLNPDHVVEVTAKQKRKRQSEVLFLLQKGSSGAQISFPSGAAGVLFEFFNHSHKLKLFLCIYKAALSTFIAQQEPWTY